MWSAGAGLFFFDSGLVADPGVGEADKADEAVCVVGVGVIETGIDGRTKLY